MKRGEVYWVDFDPSRGGEIRKRRPAIIISNDASNKALNRVQLVPLTGNASKFFPSEALVVLCGKQSKALADQIVTADKSRIGEYLATISAEEMARVERALAIQLGLWTLH